MGISGIPLSKTFTVSFFGHRILYNTQFLERELERLISGFLMEKEYVEFLVGRNGEFDLLAASVIHRCKRTIRGDNSALVLVMPYLSAGFEKNEEAYRDYYDEIEICERSANMYYKVAIQERNRYMVNRSDFVVFCVQRENGGAWRTMRYAQSRGFPYRNLYSFLDVRY